MVTVTEVLGASNAGKYGSTLACTAGEVKVKVDDKGNFTMPDAAVTCTFTNDRTTVVPPDPADGHRRDLRSERPGCAAARLHHDPGEP